jgi:dynein intermediate chain
MDRQSLLEEKRRRLAQLRQRRQETSPNLVEELLEKHQHAGGSGTKLVNVGIQVDLKVEEITTVSAPISSNDLKECLTFDKAVQATPIMYDEPVKTIFVLEPKNSEPDLKSVPKPGPSQTVKQKDTSYFETYCKSRPQELHSNHEFVTSFDVVNKVPPVKGRKVNQIQFSAKFPELLVASYFPVDNSLSHSGAGDNDNSSGLAIVYSIGESQFEPQFHLCCSSPISSIIFDKIEPNKIIGGLTDGRICIWNLNDSIAAKSEILPMLSSPLISTIIESPFAVQQHILPIIALFQITDDGNNSVLSISLDGVLNVWSTNLLALPKQDSIRFDPTEEDLSHFHEQPQIVKAILLDSEKVVSNRSQDTPDETRFLERLVVANGAGTIYKMSNMKTKKYVRSTHEIDSEITTSSTNAIVSLKPLLDKYVITSNYDWHLRLWDLQSKHPIVDIPTDALVFLIAVRPKGQLQFVTVGVDAQTTHPLIQFWDLNKKLLGPLFDIPLVENDIIATSVSFDSRGDRLIIGFNDGSIISVEVSDKLLNQQIASQNVQPEDGINAYLAT